ncbi:MAG: GAK system ATP-grasp enzyme [Pseudomonadota bacterium]
MRIGVIGIPGKWSTEALADALEARTDYRRVMDMADIRLDLNTMQLMHREQDLCELDGLAVKKITQEYCPNTLDRLELLRVAEGRGVRVFSPALNMLRLVDRLSCTVTLRNHGIPMPETVVTENIEQAVATVQSFGSAIFKPLFSTTARGMELLDRGIGEQALRSAITAFAETNPMMYIQRRLDLAGRDLGLVFVGGGYYGAYARVSHNDAWNTTINSGGTYRAADPGAEIIELASSAQAPFELDFTTVDVAESSDGPIVFEVSAFGGFRGAREGAGLDAAGAYAELILKSLKSGP